MADGKGTAEAKLYGHQGEIVCLKLSGGEYIVCCERQVEPILRKQKPPACLAAVFDLVCLKLSGGQFETKYPERIQ